MLCIDEGFSLYNHDPAYKQRALRQGRREAEMHLSLVGSSSRDEDEALE